MSDKILNEAFDKMKAIEESDDPFCIGAEAEEVVETYTELEEAPDNLGQLENELENMRDGIDEFQGIQQELFEVIERLNDAIRAYAPRQHSYWKSYGLAQLSIVAGSEEFASNDKNIGSLIEELMDEYEAIKQEMGGQ